jgi:hypothetical protein
MKNHRLSFYRMAALLAIVTCTLASHAQTSTSWKGTVSTDWSTAGNWTAGVPNSTRDVIIGDANFTGPNQPTTTAKASCKSLTIGAGTKVSVLTVNQALTILGDVKIGANGTLNQSTPKAISLAGNWSNLGTYTPGQNRSVVTFSGTSQTLSGATAFNRLNINAGSKTVLAANISVNTQLTVSGTLDPGDSPTFTISGNAKFALRSGGTLLVKAATFAGNYALNGAKTFAAASTIDYAATTINQTVANNLTYGTLRISGGTTKTLAGNLPGLNASTATSGNIIVAAGTLDLTSFSADRAGGTAGGTLSVANGSSLKIGGTHTFPANYVTHSLGVSSTVEYSGTSQTVSAEAYGNLKLSSSNGAAVKTMPATAMTIAGNLTSTVGSGTSVSFTAVAAITVRGNVTLGASTAFNGGSFSHSFGGNWTNDGTFTGATSSATFTGTGALLSGAGANNFNNVTFSGAGINVSSTTSLNVAGNFSTTGAGTFTHLSGGSGVTMTGAGRTISGNGITFNHLTLSSTITVANSLTINGNLNVTGGLSASAGTITMTGVGNTIGGAGAIAFNALNVRGVIATGSSFSLKSDLSVPGSLTASAGTASFVGTSTVSGSPNLFNVTLNGTKLQLGANAVLGIAGSFAITAGAFDSASTVPNTVNYNASGAQTIFPTSYDNLTLSGGGAKTAVGSFTALGDLTISPGVSFVAGTFTHSLYGNWANFGTFTAGTGTIQLTGASDVSISGATTFNTLTINKSSVNNIVTLGSSIGVTLLNMTSGKMFTGPSSVTITSNRTGNGIILGTITRIHTFASGIPYDFESPNNTITFSNLTSVSSITVQASKGPVLDFPFGASVNREYSISLLSSGPYAATLRLHYDDADLNGNLKFALQLLHFDPPWTLSGVTARDSVNDWVEQNSLSDITGRWTVSDNPRIVAWNGSVSSAWENAANWDSIAGSATTPPGTNELVALGNTNFLNQPTISSAVAIRGISFGSVKPTTLTLGSGASLSTLGNISGIWDSNATHTILVGSRALSVQGDLQLSDGTNGHAINLTMDSGSAIVSGDLTQSGGANLSITNTGSLQIGGGFFFSSGSFNAGSGSVTYNGSAAQVVAGNITYHDLLFAKSAGTATLTNAAIVAGNLLLTNGGTFLTKAALTVSNDVVLLPNTTLDGDSSTIHVGGDWTNNGTFSPGVGAVIFDGTGAQTVTATTFNTLIVSKSANVALLAGALALNGDLDVLAGTLDLANFSATRSVVGGTLTLAPNTLLRVGSAFPANFDTTTIDPTSTVEYFGASAQTVAADTYGNLFLSNGGAVSKALGGDSTVAGDLVINPGATFNASTFSLNLLGNWTNNGSFTSSSSSVLLEGSSKAVSGATTFNNLIVPGSYLGLGDITVGSVMNISGSYAAGGTACTFAGDFLNSGSFSSSGTVTFLGTAAQTLALNAGFNSSGTVNFNGSVAPVFNSLTPPGLQNVNIGNSGGIAPDIGWTVQGNFLVNSGAAFNGSSATHVFNSNFTNLGTVSSGGTLVFNPAAPVTLALGGPSFSAAAVVFGGSGQVSFGAGAQGFNFVSVTNTSPAGLTPGGNWTLADSLAIGPASLFNAGSSLAHTLAADLSDDGVLNGGTSIITMTGAADPLNGGSVAGIGSTTFNHLTILGLVIADSDFNVAGNFTNNASFDGTGSTISFTGNTLSLIAGTTTPTPFDSLVIAKNAAATLLAVDMGGLTTLSVASGILDSSAFAINQNPLGGVLAINAGATLRLGGGITLPLFSSYSLDPASTVEYYGAVPQTIAPANYGNLVSSSTGARTLPSGSTIGIAGNFTPGANSYTNSGSTINYNGSGSQAIAAFNYFNLTSSSSGARVLPSSGTVGVAGTFTSGANSYTLTGSTVNFNGAAQNVAAFTYNNLTISGSGTKSLTGDVTVNGTLDLAAGTLADAGFTLTASGDLINQASHIGSGRIALTGGAVPHSLSGRGTYSNMELNDTNGAALNLTNLTVNGTLTLTTGLVTTTTNLVIIGPAGQVARGTGYVVGNLRKSVPSGAAQTNSFEIGDALGYTPVSLALTNVTTVGSLTARVTPGEHPDIGRSGLATSRDVNRYWTVTNNGVVFANYGATFNFTTADYDPAANFTNFRVAKLDGTNWTRPTVIARTATSIQAAGMTNFSDFVVGEFFVTNVPSILTQPQSQRVDLGSNATFTVTATGTGTLGYQWTLNGNNLPGANSSILVVPNVQDSVAGNYAVLVDVGGPSVTSSNALLTVNHPPAFASILPQTINEQVLFTLPLLATDPDGGPLTYSLVSGPLGVSVSPTGVLSWTPTEAQGPSTNTITVQVADDGTPPLTGTTNLTVTVVEVNQPPALTVPPPQTNFAGVTVSITNSATDPDIPANHLTFSLGPGAPSGAAIDPNTGVFTWTLPGPNGSFNPITVAVTDDGSPPMTNSQVLTIVVEPASAPRITKIDLLANSHISLTITGTPNQLFFVQTSPLLTNQASWTSIGTNTTPLNGTSQFQDPQPAASPVLFYRLAAP